MYVTEIHSRGERMGKRTVVKHILAEVFQKLAKHPSLNPRNSTK
jgi:hypothetical protein